MHTGSRLFAVTNVSTSAAPIAEHPVRLRFLNICHWIIGFAFALLLSAIPADTRAGAGPVTYAYDELGRLIAVVDGAGSAAQYSYDAVGNLTAITIPSAPVSIFTFTPNDGPVGLTVTIYGDHFSTTPSQNTVKFNGHVATVTASTIATITTSVPGGATTGPIQVTSPSGSATSSTNFTVTAN
jgi:YD repeat-containing protein